MLATSLLDYRIPPEVKVGYFMNIPDQDLASLRLVSSHWKTSIDRHAQFWLELVFEGRNNWYPYLSTSADPNEGGYFRFRQFRHFLTEQLATYEENCAEARRWITVYAETKNPDIVGDLFEWLKNRALIDCYNALEKFSPLPAGTVDSMSDEAVNRLLQPLKERRKLKKSHVVAFLPPEIRRIENLVQLKFRNCQLEFVSPLLGETITLTKLVFQSNSIRWMPNSFSKLTRLKTVNLSLNKLREVPPFLLNLPELTDLDLSGNSIMHVPDSISSLKKLATLDLSFNEFHVLPRSVSQLTNLTKLDCSHLPLNPDSEAFYKILSARIKADKHQSQPESPERLESLSASDTKENPPFPCP